MNLNSDIFVLIFYTVIWCFLHSALISLKLTKYLRKYLKSGFRFFRIFYNLFALGSFLLILTYERSIRGDIIFNWSGYLRIIQFLLIIISFLLFYFGAKQYSFWEFIGINQIKNTRTNLTLTHSGEFSVSGIHKFIRHPWYLGTLLIIWLRDLSISVIYMNLVLSVYLIIGSYLEEKKLVNKFGEKYLNYKKQVSMLLPVKRIKNRLNP